MTESTTLATLAVQLVTAMLATIAPTILAWAALKQSRVNHSLGNETAAKVAANTIRLDENTKTTDATAATAAAIMVKAETNSAKADTLLQKTAEIVVLADGNLTAAFAKLDVAMARIAGLETLVAEMVSSRNEASALKLETERQVREVAAAVEQREKFKVKPDVA